MMIAKDILYPGDWHLPDGRVFRCSPDDVRHFATRLSQMIEAGLRVPVCWEHQDKVAPMTREKWQARNAEIAKLTVGHAHAANIGQASELNASFDAQDEDAPYLRKSKFVSPNIVWNYQDPTGKVWDGPSITHLAITPNPVQHTQKPFRLSVGLQQFAEPIQLSLGSFKPIALGGDKMPFPPKKKKAADDKGDALDDALDDAKPDTATDDDAEAPPEAKASADAQDTPADNVDVEDAAPTDNTEPPPMNQPAAIHPKMQELLGLLATAGNPLPDDTNPDNLIDRLITSLMARNAAEGGGPQVQAVETNPPVVAMSQAELSRLRMLEKKVASDARAAVLQRIKRLHDTGRITFFIKGSLEGELNRIQLSISDQGEVVSSDLLIKIAAYEALEENSTGFGKDAIKKKVSEVPLGASGYLRPQDDAEAQKECTNRMVEAAGGAE